MDSNSILLKVKTSSKKIAKSFWAKKWYENLSTYEDLDYRLMMGRQFLSLGALVDLQMDKLTIEAKVFDQHPYDVKIYFSKNFLWNKKKS